MRWNTAPQGVAELGNLRTEGALGYSWMPGADDTITAFLFSGTEEVTAASIDLRTGASRPVARFWSIPSATLSSPPTAPSSPAIPGR